MGDSREQASPVDRVVTQPGESATRRDAKAIPISMRAAARHRYGDSSVLEMVEVPVPSPAPGEVLVAVESAALNPLDWHTMTGSPWLTRIGKGLLQPTTPIIGSDFAGRVVAVAEDVLAFAPGDEVLGSAGQACAEFVSAPAERLTTKPSTVGFDEAAGLGIAGVTALQGLRDKGELRSGQAVLINGASGGVGTAAVQLAKQMGAEVTAVCSSANVNLVRTLGADYVVDYTASDFTDTQSRYDVFLDNIGNRTLAESRHILTDTGAYVLIGGPKTNRILGPIARMAATLIRFGVSRQRARPFIATVRQADLELLADAMASGDLVTVIDTVYRLDEIRTAMDHLASGHARGKIILKP